MKNILVTAEMFNSFSVQDPWSPCLDSILAFYAIKEKLGVMEFNINIAMNESTTSDDLPLAKLNENNEQWFYACSFPFYNKQYEIERDFYKRFNVKESLLINEKVRNIELTKNQFKNYALTLKEIFTDKVQWHCKGDSSEISRLLSHCKQIGGNRNKGMGRVKRWIVEENSEDDIFLNRAYPVAYAEKEGINGLKIWRGYRPCFRKSANQALCVMPILK